MPFYVNPLWDMYKHCYIKMLLCCLCRLFFADCSVDAKINYIQCQCQCQCQCQSCGSDSIVYDQEMTYLLHIHTSNIVFILQP